MGFSAYANGSLNSAKDKRSDPQNPGAWIANAPKSTAALGVIFNRAEWYASLLDKYVGSRFGDVGQAIPLGAYSTLDGALGYTVGDNGPEWLRKATLKLALNNLVNSHKIYALTWVRRFIGRFPAAAYSPRCRCRSKASDPGRGRLLVARPVRLVCSGSSC
jgi:hypothetical protein